MLRGREMLFYGGYPLGFHNVESERKALAFQAAGMQVEYTAGVGLRDPRVSSLSQVGGLLQAKLGHSGRQAIVDDSSSLSEFPLVVLPPRAAPLLEAMNVRWIARQIRRQLLEPHAAVFWVRYPSPEFVAAIPSLAPLVVIYECLDAMHETPGTVGRWGDRFETAERALATRADVVIVPQEGLAERFRAWGAEVVVIPHGVDPIHVPRVPRVDRDGAATIGYVGTLDYRLDLDIVREIAVRRPHWRVRLHGPISEGFDIAALRDFPNVTIGAPVPYEELGAMLCTFDAGILPYHDDAFYRGMSPVKNLELMAAGVPTVARPSPAVEPYVPLVRVAETPRSFVDELDAALADDSPELVGMRRRRVENQTWAAHHATLVELVTGLALRRSSP